MSARPTPASLPGPRPLFGLGWRGNALRYALDPLGHMGRLFEQHGDVVALARGGNGNLTSAIADCRGTVLTFGASNARSVLSDSETFRISTRTGLEGSEHERLGAGIFNQNGEPHRRQRRLLLPAFHRERLASYHPDVVAITEQTLAGWRPGETLDLAEQMRRLMLRIACKALFGLEASEADRLGGLMQEGMRLARSPGVLLLPPGLPLGPRRRYLSVARQVDRALCELIARKRSEAGASDVLSVLVRACDADGGAREDELVGQANALFLAAHETTATTLCWVVLLLGLHPAVLGDLFDELRGRLHGQAPRPEQLEELPLLDRVVRESMRLLPSVAIVTRVTAGEAELGKYLLPAGMEVHLSISHTHRCPELYPQPGRFEPGRWEKLAPTPYEYLPFGAGPRLCVGMPFARLVLGVVLAVLLQRCRLDVVPGSRIDRHVGLTLGLRRGLPVVVRRPAGPLPQRPAIRGDVQEMVELG